LGGRPGQLDQWQGKLERLYDFVETRAIEPARMAQRITEVQDKIEELGKARLEVEEALQAQRLEPIDPSAVLDYVKDLKHLLEESSIFERRAFLKSFCRRYTGGRWEHYREWCSAPPSR